MRCYLRIIFTFDIYIYIYIYIYIWDTRSTHCSREILIVNSRNEWNDNRSKIIVDYSRRHGTVSFRYKRSILWAVYPVQYLSVYITQRQEKIWDISVGKKYIFVNFLFHWLLNSLRIFSRSCTKSNLMNFYFWKVRKNHVPKVLNVHVNECKKNLLFLERFFFSKQWKINFWERKCDLKNIFSNFNLFSLVVVNFL